MRSRKPNKKPGTDVLAGKLIWSSHDDDFHGSLYEQYKLGKAMKQPGGISAGTGSSVTRVGKPRQIVTIPANIPPVAVASPALLDLAKFVKTPKHVRRGKPLRERPGRNADGSHKVKLYSVQVHSNDIAWLNTQSEYFLISVPRLVLGVGVGKWSLPWDSLPLASRGGIRRTVSIPIGDDQWDKLVRYASQWRPANPDPVRFCIEATLGRATVPKPGRLLEINLALSPLMKLRQAIQLAHLTNALSRFNPPLEKLEKTLFKLHQRIEAGERCQADTDLENNLAEVLEVLRLKTELCQDASAQWDQFITLTDKSVQPTPNTERQKHDVKN